MRPKNRAGFEREGEGTFKTKDIVLRFSELAFVLKQTVEALINFSGVTIKNFLFLKQV